MKDPTMKRETKFSAFNVISLESLAFGDSQREELRWLQIGQGRPHLEIFLVWCWQWSWRDYGHFLTIAMPCLVLRWLRY